MDLETNHILLFIFAILFLYLMFFDTTKENFTTLGSGSACFRNDKCTSGTCIKSPTASLLSAGTCK